MPHRRDSPLLIYVSATCVRAYVRTTLPSMHTSYVHSVAMVPRENGEKEPKSRGQISSLLLYKLLKEDEIFASIASNQSLWDASWSRRLPGVCLACLAFVRHLFFVMLRGIAHQNRHLSDLPDEHLEKALTPGWLHDLLRRPVNPFSQLFYGFTRYAMASGAIFPSPAARRNRGTHHGCPSRARNATASPSSGTHRSWRSPCLVLFASSKYGGAHGRSNRTR